MSVLIRDMPPGMIGIPCGGTLRTPDILPAFVSMEKPPGTKFKLGLGLGPAAPLNDIGIAFMQQPHLKWLFLTNDDNLCPHDTIPRLLRHQLSVVTGLYFSRIQPFEPVLFDGIVTGEDGVRMYVRRFLKAGDAGLIPAVAFGEGCLLLQRHILEAIPYPWWEYGETRSDQCDHDMVLCRKIRELGVDMWCDTDVRVDHATSMVVRPVRNEKGEWEAHLVQGIGRAISLPAPTKPGNYVGEQK